MDDFAERLTALEKNLDLDNKRQTIREIAARSSQPDFWSNTENAQNLMKKLGSLTSLVEEFELLSLMDESEREESLSHLELQTYFSDGHDVGDALLSVHSGQGGTEACDWAAMLARMYERFAANRGWKVEKLDESAGEEAGIKSVTYQVRGDYAYGYLRGERGVHRLVRQSPFNADHLRQTSFALVEVLPVISDTQEVDLKDEDVEFESFHSSGHGGQNVNKVSTAVRLRHIPTGIVTTCQTQRTQGQNREIATRMLLAKLYALAEEARLSNEKQLKGEHKTPGWGNQIRSYVLHPYKMVKDLRTEVESANPEAVLDGDLDEFIEAELRQQV